MVIDATIQIETEDSLIYALDVILSDSSDDGNTPDTYLISAKDTGYGSNAGLVSIFNNAIGSTGSPNKLSDFIGFEQSPYFAAYENGGAAINAAKQYDSLNFPGIRLYVKNPEVNGTGISVLDGKNIRGVSVMWGPNWNSDVVPFGYFTSNRKLTSISGSIGSTTAWNSWLGLSEKCRLPFLYPTKAVYLRGWRIGGGI
jgi:hypothetical protein